MGVYASLLIPDDESKENWKGVAMLQGYEALSRPWFWKLGVTLSLQGHHIELALHGTAFGKPRSGY